MFPKKWAIPLVILFFSAPLFADTVWLKNGDIISGTIKLVDNNKLIISTKYANNITIVATEIKTFSIKKPVIIKDDLFSDKQYAKQVLPADEEGHIILAKNTEDSEPTAITKNLILIKEKDRPIFSEFTFDGSLKGGFFYDKGTKTTEQYIFDTELTGRDDLWRHGFQGSYRRSIKNDNVSTHYYSLNYNIDKFITPIFFWQSSTQYKHDWVEDIRSKRSIGTGPGYQLWDTERDSLSLALLLNYQQMHYRDGKNSDHPLGSIRWNYQRFIDGKTIRVFSTGEIGRTFNDEVTLDFSASVGLSYKVTDWFLLSTTYSKDKDKTKEGDSNNTSYNLGFGITW